MFCLKILINRGYMYPGFGRYLRLISTVCVYHHVPLRMSGNCLVNSQKRCFNFAKSLSCKEDGIEHDVMKEKKHQPTDDNFVLTCYGLGQNTDNKELYRLFYTCTKVIINKQKRFAFVWFNTEKEVDAWVKSKDEVILGCNALHLRYKGPKDEKEMRKVIHVFGLRSFTTIDDMYSAFPQADRIYIAVKASDSYVYFKTEEEATEFMKGRRTINILGKECTLQTHSKFALHMLPPGKTLLIENLHHAATKQHLLDVFRNASMVQRNTGDTFAYVIFDSPGEKEKALNEHRNAVIMGKPCNCQNFLSLQERKLRLLHAPTIKSQNAEEELRKIFPECVSIKVEPKGGAFLEFASEEDCKAALRAKQYHDLNGEELVLQPFLLRNEREEQRKKSDQSSIVIKGLPEGTTFKRLSRMFQGAYVCGAGFERSVLVVFPTVDDVDEFFRKEHVYRSILGDQVMFYRKKTSNSLRLIVSNLPDHITEEDLRHYFPSATDITKPTDALGKYNYAHVSFSQETEVIFYVRKVRELVIDGCTCPLWYRGGTFKSVFDEIHNRMLVASGIPETETLDDVKARFKSAIRVRMRADIFGHKGTAFLEFANEQDLEKTFQEYKRNWDVRLQRMRLSQKTDDDRRKRGGIMGKKRTQKVAAELTGLKLNGEPWG